MHYSHFKDERNWGSESLTELAKVNGVGLELMSSN